MHRTEVWFGSLCQTVFKHEARPGYITLYGGHAKRVAFLTQYPGCSFAQGRIISFFPMALLFPTDATVVVHQVVHVSVSKEKAKRKVRIVPLTSLIHTQRRYSTYVKYYYDDYYFKRPRMVSLSGLVLRGLPKKQKKRSISGYQHLNREPKQVFRITSSRGSRWADKRPSAIFWVLSVGS